MNLIPQPTTLPHAILVPDGIQYGSVKHRLMQYAAWCADELVPWYRPELARYRDYLLKRLSPVSTRAHLGTIRSRYRDLLLNPDLWWELVVNAAESRGERLTREQIIVNANEVKDRCAAAIDPRRAPVKTTTSRDKRDLDRVWLTAPQARWLLKQPDATNIRGQRDQAILACGLFLGLRDFEVAALRVSDLNQTLLGAPAVWVRHGKGDTERLVPWGAFLWARTLIYAWLDTAAISRDSDAIVFRGLDRWGNVSPEPLSTRGIMRVAEQFSIYLEQEPVRLTWYVLRRTYARLCYEAGQVVTAIQANMGHASQSMTWHYIGPVDGHARQTPDFLALPESE